MLLIEAGKRDWSLYIHMPATFSWPLTTKTYNWAFETEPEPHVNDRRMYQPRGKVWGGSSSVNGMCYIRGHALDYERWAEETGDPAWGYAHCLPYFKKLEHFPQVGPNDYHGVGGPTGVTRGTRWTPLYEAFIAAGVEAGYPRTDDLNGYQQEGFGPMDMSVGKGRRSSTASNYLRPALKRPNLTLIDRTLTTRILFEKTKAVGVGLSVRGSDREVRARREVILSGGTFNSPQLLMLSGVGNPDDLAALGIDVVAPLPGVGANLQDHPEIYVQYKCKTKDTLYGVLRPWRQIPIGIEWLLRGTGLGATNHFEAGGFIRSEPGIKHPNLQYHFLPVAAAYDGSGMQKVHGYQAHIGPMRPESRGWVKLASTDPARPSAHPVQLFLHRARPARVPRRHQADPRDHEPAGVRPLQRRRTGAGAVGQDRRRDRRLRPRTGRKRLSPILHLCHGQGERSHGRRGCAGPRPRCRGPAGRRRLHHAQRGIRQPERTDHHVGRETGRRDPGSSVAAAGPRPLLRPRKLGDVAALTLDPLSLQSRRSRC